jgi:hypothetical protein
MVAYESWTTPTKRSSSGSPVNPIGRKNTECESKDKNSSGVRVYGATGETTNEIGLFSFWVGTSGLASDLLLFAEDDILVCVLTHDLILGHSMGCMRSRLQWSKSQVNRVLAIRNGFEEHPNLEPSPVSHSMSDLKSIRALVCFVDPLFSSNKSDPSALF